MDSRFELALGDVVRTYAKCYCVFLSSVLDICTYRSGSGLKFRNLVDAL